MTGDPELDFTPDLTRIFEIPCPSLFDLIQYGNSQGASIVVLECRKGGEYRVSFDNLIPKNFPTARLDGPDGCCGISKTNTKDVTGPVTSTG